MMTPVRISQTTQATAAWAIRARLRRVTGRGEREVGRPKESERSGQPLYVIPASPHDDSTKVRPLCPTYYYIFPCPIDLCSPWSFLSWYCLGLCV